MPHNVPTSNAKARPRPRSTPGNDRWRPVVMAGIFLLIQGCTTTPTVTPDDEARSQAKISYLLNDYHRTLSIVLPRAEAGEAWAQYTLGYMYYYGNGLARNEQTAKRWIESAAAKGYAPAQQALQRLSAPPPAAEQHDTGYGNEGQTNPVAAPPPESLAPPPTAPITSPEAATPATATVPEASAPRPPSPQPAPPANTAPSPPPAASPPPPKPLPPQTSAPDVHGEAAAKSMPAAAADGSIKDRDWIARQDPQRYTLQLVSSIDEKAVIRLIRKRGIASHAAYYAITLKGRKWYSLLYGNYADYDAAYRALHRLPRSLRRDAPRIRRFREIQSQIGPRP